MHMSATLYDDLLAFANRLADAAGQVIRPHFRNDHTIDDKPTMDVFDPVTQADKDAEAAMRTLIEADYPDHAVYGEEYGAVWAADIGKRFTWVLDPIDGTRSFIGGFPTWGTLIALHDLDADGEQGRTIIGIIDQPVLGERFIGCVAGEIQGTWLNDTPLQVRPCPALKDAVLYATTPDMFAQPGEREAFGRVEEQVKLRRFGGDCYAYGMMAHGQNDLIIEAGMQHYDIQALIPVVEGAGGIVSNWQGGPDFDAGQIIAAGDKRVYDSALASLNP